ncbi:MAG: hypothetical protein J6M31_06925 [Bacteroidales bacterium]|nr:hypothetical protein [Bacteroidales bacterium]
MNFYRFLNILVAGSLSVFTLAAQNNQGPQTPQEKEKALMEGIDKEVQRLSELLDLEYWQEFYVDSTLTHDLKARNEELEKMQQAKVENRDLYQAVFDKWMQQIDDSYKRFFTPQQWEKYWKSSGKRAQKERDKRKEKALKAAGELKK